MSTDSPQRPGTRRLGAHRSTHPLAGRSHGLGLVGALLAVVLLAAGIGLLIGSYGAPVRGLGAGLLVLAVVAPVLAVRTEARRAGRAPRLEVYEGGVALARGDHAEVWPWAELDVTVVVDTGTYGQGGQPYSAEWVEARAGDRRVVRVSPTSDAGRALLAARPDAGDVTL